MVLEGENSSYLVNIPNDKPNFGCTVFDLNIIFRVRFLFNIPILMHIIISKKTL